MAVYLTGVETVLMKEAQAEAEAEAEKRMVRN